MRRGPSWLKVVQFANETFWKLYGFRSLASTSTESHCLGRLMVSEAESGMDAAPCQPAFRFDRHIVSLMSAVKPAMNRLAIGAGLAPECFTPLRPHVSADPSSACCMDRNSLCFILPYGSCEILTQRLSYVP